MKTLITAALLCIGAFGQLQGANVTLKHIQVKQASDLDRIWKQYFRCRDKAYIQQLLEVVNEDQGVMIIAYEYLNREFNANLRSRQEGKQVPPNVDDLNTLVKEREKEVPGFSKRVGIVAAAIWSLDSNVGQYPQVREDVQAIIKLHPDLDHGKKIKAMLGYK